MSSAEPRFFSLLSIDLKRGRGSERSPASKMDGHRRRSTSGKCWAAVDRSPAAEIVWDTAVMPIVRPDIDNWVRDRAPKFVSRATLKNLNRWHRVFDADRCESIAFWLQYCLGLRLFMLLWATEVVCCPLGLRLLRKNRARRSRSRKKACESVFGAALSLRSRSCRRVFAALFQAQLIFY